MPKILTQQDWDERAEAVGLEWLEEVQGARTTAKALCLECGSTIDAYPSDVQQGHRKCKVCWEARRSKEKIVAQETWDERALEAGLSWVRPVTGARVKTEAECLSCGNRWNAIPYAVKAGSGCPECGISKRAAAKRIPQEVWDKRAAALELEWLEPVTSGAKPTQCRCLNCGLVTAKRPNGVGAGKGCSRCAGNAQVPQEEWDRRAAAVKLQWLEPVTTNGVKTLAECLKCSHTWSIAPSDVQQGQACPECARKKKGQYQVLPQSEWQRRAAAVGLKWLEPVKHSGTPTMALCLECGNKWPKSPDGVTSGSGCPNCASTGFDYSAPSTVYLLVNQDGIAKVGITGQGRVRRLRLNKLALQGFELERVWEFDSGADARTVEKETHRRWRLEDGLPPAIPAGTEGYTETVDTGQLALEVIVRRINILARKQPSFQAESRTAASTAG